jgi:hypothetical protein
MALADGDEAAQLAALEIFERLGAGPAAERLRQALRAGSVRGIPRGPRQSTKENPAGRATAALTAATSSPERAASPPSGLKDSSRNEHLLFEACE